MTLKPVSSTVELANDTKDWEDENLPIMAELGNIHDIYTSLNMRKDFLDNYTKDPKKSLRENIADYIEKWEAEHTDGNMEAGYWIQLGHEPWKARHLANISRDYGKSMNNAEIIEVFEEEDDYY